MRKHEKIVWVPDIPDLDEVIPSAIRKTTAALSGWTSLELGRAHQRVGVSCGKARAVDRSTDSDAHHGRLGGHRVPDQHPAIGAGGEDRSAKCGVTRLRLFLLIGLARDRRREESIHTVNRSKDIVIVYVITLLHY